MSISQILDIQAAESQPIAPPRPQFTIRPSTGWSMVNIRELWRFRDLLMSLSNRDLKLRYKQTALGVIWVVLQPLLGASVFSFVFGKVARMPSNGVPYFLFSYAGLLGWNLFNGTLTKCSTCLVGNSHLISKVFFPRLVLPLSTVPSSLVDFAVAFVVMVIMILASGRSIGAPFLLLPLWMLMLIMLSQGVGLLCAALAVSYRDIPYILPVFTQILLYGSPVAYAVSAVPHDLRAMYMLNPLSSILEAFRWSLLGVGRPDPAMLAYSGLVCVLSVVIGVASFKRMERKFADVI